MKGCIGKLKYIERDKLGETDWTQTMGEIDGAHWMNELQNKAALPDLSPE